MSDSKVRTGATTNWRWTAPEPVTGTPVLTFRLSTGDQIVALTAARANDTVTAISNDRRTLTLSAAVTGGLYQGVQGRFGGAWLLSDNSGAFPVRVTELVASTATITAALPRGVSVANGGVLHWADWSGSIGPGDVTGTVERNIPWVVTYSALYGDDVPTTSGQQEGLLHVVREPFSTGLDHNVLLGYRFELANMVPRTQEDLTPQIRVAESMLIRRVRADLFGRGLAEDDIIGAQLLQPAHAFLSASLVHGSGDVALDLRRDGWAEYESAMTRIIADANRDGVVDDGEEIQLQGVRPSSVSFSAGVATADRLFSIGMAK